MVATENAAKARNDDEKAAVLERQTN